MDVNEEVLRYFNNYRKRHKKHLPLDKFAEYMNSNFISELAYKFNSNLCKLYNRDSLDKIIKDYIFRKNVIILILYNEGITFIGSKEKMLDINIIKPIINHTYKEKPLVFKFKDKNNILRTSCNIILSELPINSLSYKDGNLTDYL